MSTIASQITPRQTTRLKKVKTIRQRPGLKDLPEFSAVRVNVDQIEFSLTDGRMVTIPLIWSERLQRATPDQRQAFIVSPLNVFWDEIDEIIGVENVLYGNKLYL
ncbi:DUF2442 domain-containing protein [Spirosoma utsteinense]|uniref:DUF2442 domain-containing protein n=1 Tax=Spirosoma utsteinense TaxID=2585773 RepID=A0ABR6W1T3_9BACT|nr:DUF2442 domain-containing protein [Spirosoma utsteinense]MBC3785222.1 hypothetical protein [Spirosoma utsteinense]MBC3790553.1 hypothetical protein [Spirosoma utsteinense]